MFGKWEQVEINTYFVQNDCFKNIYHSTCVTFNNVAFNKCKMCKTYEFTTTQKVQPDPTHGKKYSSNMSVLKTITIPRIKCIKVPHGNIFQNKSKRGADHSGPAV
jgi:hypothetical protein